MLGGSNSTEKKARLITKIEQSIFKGIITRAIADLQKSWRNVAPLTFVMDRYETEGDFAQIAPASEIVLAIAMELTIDDEKHLMNVCFPTFALEEVLAKLNVQQFGGASAGKGTEWSNSLKKQLEQASVSLTAVLGTSAITLRELLDLEEGDIVRTQIGIKHDVEVKIGGKPRFWGTPGVSNGKVAVKVTRLASPHRKEE
jgi:flagellar motor switch protein FliM